MQIPVLLYHKIDLPTSDVKIRGAFTSPRKFARQIGFLKKKGFEFYTASELAGAFIANGEFPPNSIAITFDDGWKDNYLHAFPVLKKFGVKATIFLVPECIGQNTDRVTAQGEGPREHLSQSEIAEMSRYGIEFGSHSMSHKLFDRISPAETLYEITESKKFIEGRLQKECSVFAYPAGFYTDFAKEEIKKAGYRAAFSTVYGAEDKADIYALNRTEILRRDGRPFQFGKKIKALTNNG